jgi:hypothetical protein
MASAPEVAPSTDSRNGSNVATPLRTRAFETSVPSGQTRSVDLADTDRRGKIRSERRPTRRASQNQQTCQTDRQSKERGIIFADHLAAAMAS